VEWGMAAESSVVVATGVEISILFVSGVVSVVGTIIPVTVNEGIVATEWGVIEVK